MTRALLRIYAAIWPVVLVCFWAVVWGFAWGDGFQHVTGWDAFAKTALGLVVALEVLCIVDLWVALSSRRREYVPLLGGGQLPLSLQPWAWLIAPIGLLAGFVIGWLDW